jgi:hypothetical protein
LTLAIDIVKKCFSTHSPKSVQKLGLFKLQPLLNDFKQLYFTYVEVLLTIDAEIKQIILSEEPIRTGEEIYYSLGSVSFNYKLKSDLNNFDMAQLANALIDVIIAQEKESFDIEHIQVLMVCCANKDNLEIGSFTEAWLKIFSKIKEYLLVSICDQEICASSIVILHNFLTADHLKHQICAETKELLVKSLELLYSGDTEPCKNNFRDYLLSKVVARTEDSDNALKKFMKSVLQQLN